MTRATETHQIMLPYLLSAKSLKAPSSLISSSSIPSSSPSSTTTHILPLHHIHPCSMIREGAVYRPIPTNDTWIVKDERFVKDHHRIEAAYIQRSIHNDDEDDDDDNDNDDNDSQSSSKPMHNHSKIFICHGMYSLYYSVYRYYMDMLHMGVMHFFISA